MIAMPSWWKLAAAALALWLAFTAGWAVQGWRKDAVLQQWLAAAAQAGREAEAAARKKEAALTQQLEEARHAAVKREETLRRDAGAARDAADGLRGELAAIRRSLPGLAADAVRQYADTLADVFGACTDRYRELAEEAGRVESDRQTLMDAWPTD